MRHLSDGTLRRIYDEPLALKATDQAHYDECAECKARFQSIANDARATAGLLTVPDFDVQPAAAFATVHGRIRASEAARPPRRYERWLENALPRWRPVATPALAVLLAAAMLAGFTASGVAQNLIKIFEPHSFAAVEVSSSDFARTGKLLDYGTVKWLPGPPQAEQIADATDAQARSGFSVLTPSSLPNGIAGPVRYGVISHATGSLTFDAARLRASAAKQNVNIGAMPSSIDGSTLYVNGGPALIELWGTTAASGVESQAPGLVIVRTKVPTVYSTGATAAQLENYLLAQPGVPPDIAAQVKAIKDPATTLPIPIPAGFATTKPVQVNGVQGLLVSAVVGTGLVWEKNGVIYAVGGQLTPDQVLAIAISLH